MKSTKRHLPTTHRDRKFLPENPDLQQSRLIQISTRIKYRVHPKLLRSVLSLLSLLLKRKLRFSSHPQARFSSHLQVRFTIYRQLRFASPLQLLQNRAFLTQMKTRRVSVRNQSPRVPKTISRVQKPNPRVSKMRLWCRKPLRCWPSLIRASIPIRILFRKKKFQNRKHRDRLHRDLRPSLPEKESRL